MTCGICKNQAERLYDSNKVNVCPECYAKRLGGVWVDKPTEEMVECDNCKRDTNQEYFKVDQINLCEECYTNKLNNKWV